MVKISGKNLGGLVYTLKLVFVLIIMNCCLMGRSWAMVNRASQAFVKAIKELVQDYKITKIYLQCDAVVVAYDFINDSRTKMARPSVVRVDWDQREERGRGLAVAVPSFSRVSGGLPRRPAPWPGPNNCLSEDFLAPTPRPRHKTLHPFEFKWGDARRPDCEPHADLIVRKSIFQTQKLVGNKISSLMASANSNSGC